MKKCTFMANAERTPQFLIIDDFLDEETWTKVWSDFQFVDLHPVTRTMGAWKLDDGFPLAGKEVVAPKPGSGTPSLGTSPLELMLAALLARPDYYAEVVGEDWLRVTARPYVYPKDSGLSWHVDDHELYAGAFIYYAHPYWNAHWGGELLLAEMDDEPIENVAEMPIMGHRFETEEYSTRLLETGTGTFIMPKPNRLVLLKGAPHMVSRVSPAAGASVRASVSGFFLRQAEGSYEQDDN